VHVRACVNTGRHLRRWVDWQVHAGISTPHRCTAWSSCHLIHLW